MNSLPIAVIGLVAAILAFDKRYEDGLIRHVSLAGIVVAATVMMLGEVTQSYTYDFTWEMSLLLWSIAVFVVCHAYTFIRWRLTGKSAWRDQELRKSEGQPKSH